MAVSAAISWGRVASAAPPSPSENKPTKLVIDQDLGSMQAARAGRARAQKGDCKGALDAFDEALRTSVDPSLYRDRGICHEQLGHPYPAMDDYRAYLTAAPEAKDADAVRARLAKMEAETGVVAAKTDDQIAEEKAHKRQDDSAKAAALGSGTVSLGFDDPSSSSSSSSSSASASTSSADDKRALDAIEAEEARNAEADASPLRRGTGFVIGPYINIRRWFEKELGWSEAFGGTLRYSFGKTSSVVSEIGYMNVGSTGASTSAGGLSSFIGYEARLGLDPAVANALLFVIGGGYDRFKRSATGEVMSTFEGRARVGFRHVFGPALGLEVTADGGVAHLTLVQAPAGVDAGKTTGFLGGNIALVVGF